MVSQWLYEAFGVTRRINSLSLVDSSNGGSFLRRRLVVAWKQILVVYLVSICICYSSYYLRWECIIHIRTLCFGFFSLYLIWGWLLEPSFALLVQ